MQFSTIKTRVAEYLDRDDLGTKIAGWINDTRKDIAIKYDFDYLYVETTIITTAGCATYAYPADYLGHETIWAKAKKLSRLRPREADELTPTDITLDSGTLYLTTETGNVTTLSQGSPDYYVTRGMNFQVYPTPDSAYTITMKYFAQPSSWAESTTADDTEEDYISRFHFEAIIWGASLRGAIFLDDEQKKTNYGTAYDTAVKEMIRREMDKEYRDTKVRMKTWKDFDLTTFQRLHKVTTG